MDMETDEANRTLFYLIRFWWQSYKIDNTIMFVQMQAKELRHRGKCIFFPFFPFSTLSVHFRWPASFVLAFNAIQTDWWLWIFLLSIFRSTNALEKINAEIQHKRALAIKTKERKWSDKEKNLKSFQINKFRTMIRAEKKGKGPCQQCLLPDLWWRWERDRVKEEVHEGWK